MHNDNHPADLESLLAQAEGCLTGIASIQRLLEDAPSRLSEVEGATMPLGDAVSILVGDARLAELSAYVSDAEHALLSLAALGNAPASVALWDVYRCDPGRANTTAASMLTANVDAVMIILRECCRQVA